VIEEGDRIYGDGVNIAARLESLADAGGICVSKTAFDQIETKLPMGYEYLGEQTVKNIVRPVGAYRVVLEPRVTRGRGARPTAQGTRRKIAVYGLAAVLVAAVGVGLWGVLLKPQEPPAPVVEKADPAKMALPLPDKPSIAVLPFVNLSEDPKQEFFSDGIAHEIITALSKLSQIFVIARSSSFAFKGKPVSIKQVSETMGVRYVLEGSVRRDGDRVRISAQLVDAMTGHQMWAERYDRDLKDIFSLQDEITMKIVTELRVKLTAGEGGRLAARGTTNLDAYLKALEASEQIGRWTRDSNIVAKQLAEEAIALDPNYHLAYMLLSVTHDSDVFFGTTDSPQKSLKKGIELAEKAISLDASNSVAYGQLGLLYIRLKEYDKAVELARTCAPLGPSNFEANRMAAQVLARAGKVEEALPLLDNAVRLNPIPRYTFLIAAASIYNQARNYEKALQIYKMAARLEPKNTGGYAGIAATSSLMGKMEEARAAAAELRRVDPNYSLEQVKKALALRGDKDQDFVNRFIQGLRSAGIPETPPLSIQPSTKTTIAVLPFQNMTGDPQQEYFSEGMAEQIIAGLSQTPDIYVSARTSSFAFKGKSITAQQIAEQLRVRYLIEGSVQRDAARVRINIQLIDGRDGRHIWAKRYDDLLEDLFALQDLITMEVMEALNVQFIPGITETNLSINLKQYRPSSLRAYEAYLKGVNLFFRRTVADTIAARKLFEEAVTLDPNFAAAYRTLGFSYLDDFWYRLTATPEKSVEMAEQAAEKFSALSPGQPPPHGLLSMIRLVRKDFAKAVWHAEKAVEQSPNDPGGHYSLALALRFAERFEEAIKAQETSFRLSPLRPLTWINNLAWAHLGSQHYDRAISLYLEMIERSPDSLFAFQGLAIAYELSGDHEKARWAAENVMRIDPAFSLVREEKMALIVSGAYKQRIFDAWLSAGLK
jgi:adenylate cyclase